MRVCERLKLVYQGNPLAINSEISGFMTKSGYHFQGAVIGNNGECSLYFCPTKEITVDLVNLETALRGLQFGDSFKRAQASWPTGVFGDEPIVHPQPRNNLEPLEVPA